MQLIKNKAVAQDQWQFVADDEPLRADFTIISLARWLQQAPELSQQQHLGVRLGAEVIIEDLKPQDLQALDLINLHFQVFTDGRSFTQARVLRSRIGFNGDLRVSGDFMRDQVFYLSRVGVSSFELNDQEDIQGVISAIEGFSVNYQASVA